jgi:putative phosphoesterase
MKIGIVSDSHGMTRRLADALEAICQRKVDAIVHCGDLMGVESVELLAQAGPPAYAVAGNMDHDIAPLADAAAAGGVEFSGEVVEVMLGDGGLLVATHGNDHRLLAELIAEGRFRYVCHGHTHRRRDERLDGVRVINPGALSHPKEPAFPSAAVLNTRTDQIEWLKIGP